MSASLDVGKVAHARDLAIAEQEGHEEPPARLGSLEPRRPRRLDLLAVAPAERVDERVLDHVAAAARELELAEQARPGAQRHAEPDAPRPLGERARRDEGDGGDRLPGDVVRRQLRREPAREKTRHAQRLRAARREPGVPREPGADAGSRRERPRARSIPSGSSGFEHPNPGFRVPRFRIGALRRPYPARSDGSPSGRVHRRGPFSRAAAARCRPAGGSRACAGRARVGGSPWMRWIVLTSGRRSATTRRAAASSAAGPSPASRQGPRWFAATSASRSAMLMPCAPTGDIGCAASPSSRTPGADQSSR